MRKKVIAILVTLILTGLVVAGCGFGGASEPSEQVIDLPCTWSLESLGYSDLVFSCENPHEAKRVYFTLPEDAAQGPEKWYILYLHFSITFSEESEVSGSFPYGRTYVEASTGSPTDDRCCAMIKFINEEVAGHTVIKWNIGSENLLGGGSSHSSTSLNIDDVRFANYLGIYGVWPGKNILRLSLTQHDGAKVESLIIFADSGIEYSSEPNPRWEKAWGEPEIPPGWEAPTKLTEEEEARTLEIALSDSRVEELLEGRDYTILKTGSNDYSDPPRKSRVVILLDRLYEIKYDWPWPPGEQRHSTEIVRLLDILIDLQEGRVLGISPMPQGWSMRPIPSGFKKPELTEEEKERAIQIALEDNHVQELLQGKNYTVRTVGVWHEGEEKLGAVVVIGFDQVYFIDYDWPRWDCQKEQRVYLHRAVHVEEIVATVDFRSGEVIEVTDSPVLTSKAGMGVQND